MDTHTCAPHKHARGSITLCVYKSNQNHSDSSLFATEQLVSIERLKLALLSRTRAPFILYCVPSRQLGRRGGFS